MAVKAAVWSKPKTRAEEIAESRQVFRDFLGKKTGYAWAVYPTSFGLSVWVTDNPVGNKQVKELKNLLDKVGIIYSNEVSPRENVIRFRISTSQRNLQRIMDLTKSYGRRQ